jgi:hypothetical protein
MITSTDSTVVTLDSIHVTLQSVVASLETVETRLGAASQHGVLCAPCFVLFVLPL